MCIASFPGRRTGGGPGDEATLSATPWPVHHRSSLLLLRAEEEDVAKKKLHDCSTRIVMHVHCCFSAVIWDTLCLTDVDNIWAALCIWDLSLNMIAYGTLQSAGRME